MVGRYKSRMVSSVPDATYFKPVGIPVKCLEEIKLTVEEAEAVRLKDMEHLEQEQGAEKMNVSRPTFQRILTSARQKMAEALLKGKAIRIEGGHFEIAPVQFKCAEGHIWSVPFPLSAERSPHLCPVCRTSEIELLSPVTIDCPIRGRYICCEHCPRFSHSAGKPVEAVAGIEGIEKSF